MEPKSEALSTTGKDRLAVVILNWNGEKMLRDFLPTVCRYSQLDGVVVYVADNASTDASCACVEQEFPTVRLIRMEQNYGFAEGYNRALAQIEATYYLLLNSDVEVTEGWLTPLLSFMESHPEVAACQPKLLSWRKREMFEYAGACGGFIDRLGYPYCRGRIFDVVEKDEGQYDTCVPIFWASGAALMVRSTDYRKLGGLDATFFAHMEEIDFCWRLHQAGRMIYCIPQSRVYHLGGATLSKENPYKTYLNFRNNLLMLYKNLPSCRLFPVLAMRGVLDYMALMVFLLKGHTGDAKAVFRARRDFWKMSDYRKKARKEVWEYALDKEIPEQRPTSILWSYHVKRVRSFLFLDGANGK